MLAMRNEETMLFLMALFGAITIWTWLAHHSKVKQKRLEVIQRAIESGNLDEATRRTILDALTGEGRQNSEWARALAQQLAFVARNLLFVLGWLTMFVGAGCWLAGEMFGWGRWDVQPAVIATFVGLGLVTVPVAMRELEVRRLRDRARAAPGRPRLEAAAAAGILPPWLCPPPVTSSTSPAYGCGTGASPTPPCRCSGTRGFAPAPAAPSTSRAASN